MTKRPQLFGKGGTHDGPRTGVSGVSRLGADFRKRLEMVEPKIVVELKEHRKPKRKLRLRSQDEADDPCPF